MKLRTVGLLLILVAGCSQTGSELANEEEASENVAHDRLAEIQETEQFNKDLEALNELAKSNESEFNFADAATVWGQVQQLVSERFGPDSWQAFNAKLAHDSTFRKSQFDSSELAIEKQITRQLEQVKESIKTKQLAQALATNNKIVELSEQLYGGSSVEFSQALVRSATLESGNQNYSTATKQFHQAIEILRQHGFEDHPDLETAHAGLASAYSKQSKLPPAAANQKEATRISAAVWGRESLNFAIQANQLGVIYHKAGNLDVAFEILDRAKQIREKLLGTDHAMFAHSCLNLGALMLDLDRPDNAEGYLNTALKIFERDFGTDQALTNRAKSHLATIYMLRKKPELAEPLLQSVTKSLEEGGEEQIQHQFRLSIAYARQGKYDQAKPLLESTIQQQKEKFGSADQRTINSLRAYALVLERTHQTEAAKTVKDHINRVAQQIDSQDFQSRY